MTKDETLKLALEALKQIDEAMPFPVAKLAQAAIKEALAQPERDLDAGATIDERWYITRKPEQEPVGDFDITKDMAEHIKNLEVDWTICASGSKRPTEKKVVPVFVGNTTPPQRKPLSDEEILTYRYMIDWTAEWSYINFARAIEAAHGIKGEA